MHEGNNVLPSYLLRIIDGFERLPGIGHKSAERLSLYCLNPDINLWLKEFSQDLMTLSNKLKSCEICGILIEPDQNECRFCLQKSNRNEKLILVVASIIDIIAIEKTGFDGLYHILGGVLSPSSNIGAGDLNIDSLILRIKKFQENFPNSKLEIILGTNPNVEGETTALYIKKIIEQSGLLDLVTITKLGLGLPVGMDLEYIDQVTLSHSLSTRRLL